MILKTSNLTLLFMALGIFSLFASGCKQNANQSISEKSESIPTLQEVDSIRKSNAVGQNIKNEDSLFMSLSNQQVIGFGHNHTCDSDYLAFQHHFEQLRKQGFNYLALELPSSLQPLLDSIMDENTPRDKTNSLLKKLNTNLKTGDSNKEYDLNSNTRHPLFDVILNWLNTGGIVVAIDVPYIYDDSLNRNVYFTDMMFKTVKEQSNTLFNQIKSIEINKLDNDKELKTISEVRAAYMASLINLYVSKNAKIVTFLGSNHILSKVKPVKSVGVSVVQILRNSFSNKVTSFYPYNTSTSKGIFSGNNILGDFAFGGY